MGTEAPERDRQLIKYTFWKVESEALSWPPSRRAAAAMELAGLLEERTETGTLHTYSTVGLRGDCDVLIWQAASTVDEIQLAEASWRATTLGPQLATPHSFLAMTRSSPYLAPHRRPDREVRRHRIKRPHGSRYLFVYPMVKKRSWYRLPFERRKAMMIEHFAIGHRFPQVKINTAYSFGLDDPEFVVAFESDEPAAFLDLVMELRESLASRYTERETPIFTCVRMEPRAALNLALGLAERVSDATAELASAVGVLGDR